MSGVLDLEVLTKITKGSSVIQRSSTASITSLFRARPMPLPDLTKLTAGLSKTWAGYIRDGDRTLRSVNHPETTRYNAVTKAHVEAFQGWMIETRSASTALKQAQGAPVVLQVAVGG
ncbi:hypothetical protein [Amycolatopsis pithecellobii]|uniref:hypothetical protein n=1 Tax=Amycolatopsis pithecellobii TaxID=664692 RepID=UPI001FE4E673|nr:hypothetical protein [Amycolatopsis pithecellobii]